VHNGVKYFMKSFLNLCLIHQQISRFLIVETKKIENEY
jgi:hypothetical protein